MPLTDREKEIVREDAEKQNAYLSEKQEWNFKLHELKQRHVLIQLQMVNFAVLAVLLLFLLLYYRPPGVAQYLSKWSWPFFVQSASAAAATKAPAPAPAPAPARVLAPGPRADR